MPISATPPAKINITKYSKLLAAAHPVPPRNEDENELLIEQLAKLDELKSPTAEQRILAEVLAILIEDFERKNYPLPKVSPRESLLALMEDRGLKHKDVWPIIGNKGLTSEILNGNREISKETAKRLAEHFKVPIDLFI